MRLSDRALRILGLFGLAVFVAAFVAILVRYHRGEPHLLPGLIWCVGTAAIGMTGVIVARLTLIQRQYRIELAAINAEYDAAVAAINAEYEAARARIYGRAEAPDGDREFVPDWCLPPGQILAAEMEARGCTAGDIAAGTGFTAETVLNVLDALTPLTEDIAARLEQLWGTPASFWLRLESLWRQHLGQGAQ